MSAAASGGGFGAQDWAQIIQGAGQGASGAMESMAKNANSRAEAKEAKRRTLANILSQAMKRNRSLNRVGQEYGDDMSDYKSQAIQQVARGFADTLQGSTRR